MSLRGKFIDDISDFQKGEALVRDMWGKCHLHNDLHQPSYYMPRQHWWNWHAHEQLRLW